MKRLLYIILLASLMTGFYGCINDPKLTFEGEVIGAGNPVFNNDKELEKEVGKTATTVTVKADLVKENGYKVTERGFIYGLKEEPSLENGGTKLPDPEGVGLGVYTMTIEGLTNNKTYHIRGYAENKHGIGYGPNISVWTNEGIAQVVTLPPNSDDIRSTSAIIGGEVEVIGEGDICQLGFYVYEKDNSNKMDTFYCYVPEPRETEKGERFFYHLSNLKPATCYLVKAFIKNNFGEMFAKEEPFCTRDGIPQVDEVTIRSTGFTTAFISSQVSDGGDTTIHIIERGFCWSETPTPLISDNTFNCGAGAGVFEGEITGLESDKKYYICAYAISDQQIVGYGTVNTIQTSTSKPTVDTEEVRDETITNGGAEVRGIIRKAGQSPVTSSGICWSTTHTQPTIEEDRVLPLTSMGGIIAGRLTGLKGGTTYYIRAFAINAYGISYGGMVQFKTPPIFTTGLSPFPGGQRVANTAAYFALGTNLYILGGDMGSSYSNDLKRYNIAENIWDDRWPFSGSPMKLQSGVAFGAAAFVYGGYSGLGDERPGIYEYDEQRNEWYYYSGPDSSIVNSVLGYSYSNSIFYVGGKNADNTIRDDVWSFMPNTKIWERKTTFPTKQYGGVAVVIDGVAYVGMGRNSDNICNDSIWTSDNFASTWNYRTSYSDAGFVRGGVVCNNRLYIVSNDYFLVEYQPDTDEWTQKSKIINNMNNLQCIYSVGNKIYIGLGNNPITLIVYDPSWDN